MNQHNNWMPQMSMPPVGFGVVMPQPGGTVPLPSTYGVTPHTQGQASNNSDSSSQWIYQPYSVGQQQQQEWLKAQQKAIQEQKLLYEKMMKQRQFDEQKQRLKEFSSRTKKNSVSADAMIQNIFEKEEQSSKTRITKTCAAGASHSALENNVSDPNNFYRNQIAFSDRTNRGSAMSQTQHPSSKVNYSETNSSRSSAKDLPLGVTSSPSNTNSAPSSDLFNSTTSVKGLNSNMSHPVQPLSNDGKVSSIHNLESNVTPRQAAPLKLPHWLAESSKIPELYSKASGLVQTPDGEWVDTSRAYMLLMQTQVPPHFLGVLWEMVNKTQPGRLKVSEFHGLLALVACVQNGKNFITAEVLTMLEYPIYPVINHPVLLPLTQKNQQKQTDGVVSPHVEPVQSSQEVVSTPPSESRNPPEPTSHPADQFSDGDDFDDFVSAVVPPIDSATIPPVEDTSVKNMPSFPLPPPPLLNNIIRPVSSSQHKGTLDATIGQPMSSNQQKETPDINMLQPVCGRHQRAVDTNVLQPVASSHKGTVDATISQPTVSSNQKISHTNNKIQSSFSSSQKVTLDSNMIQAAFSNQKGALDTKSNPVKNLPTLGNSPLNYPKGVLGTNTVVDDDDFDDFQSAIPDSSQACDLSSISSDPTSQLDDKIATNYDKYAIFRDLQEDSEEMSTVRPETSTTEELHFFEKNHVPEPSCDEFSGIKTSADFDSCESFGEFVTKRNLPNRVEGSSESSTYVTANASADTSNDDDEFGDFIGPSESADQNLFNKCILNIPETQSETQSVASLELPGLDLTVNLAFSDNMISSVSKSELDTLPSSCPAKTDQNWLTSDQDLDQQFQTLRLEEGQDSEPSIMDEAFASLEAHGVQNDKYDAIREFGPKIDVNSHIDVTWEKCLQCCNRLLEEGVTIATAVCSDDSVCNHLHSMQTMKDYVMNLGEVWNMSSRISSSNQNSETSPVVSDMCATANRLWESFCRLLGKDLTQTLIKDSRIFCSENGDQVESTCNICLVVDSHVTLVYGGQNYHPQCANLWVNTVDIILPSLSSVNKPVLCNSKPTLL